MRILIAGGGAAAVEAAANARLLLPESEIVIFSSEKLLPYRRPLLPRLINAESLPGYFFIHNQDFYSQNNIELRLDTAVAAVDPAGKKIHLANGQSEHFDSLLLATGSHARKLPGNDDALTLHDYGDLEKIRTAFAGNKKVLITGGGVLGLEIAGELLKNGGKVTVCERSKYLLESVLNESAAEFLKNLLRRKKSLKIILDSENNPPRLNKSLNISAIGTTPDIVPFTAPYERKKL
ncbi:MAG: FAD-dependent oxidoreductase, partial [Lentisphaeria bacterium]|nr:FAD-dependent oxidoreductase [Lentisphaeria bacterium]